MKFIRLGLGLTCAVVAALLSFALSFAQHAAAQEVRTFDPRGIVIGVGFGTATYSGDLGSAFEEANGGLRFESYYNLSHKLSMGLNFISSKYGRAEESRGSLGFSARFRFLEDRLSPYVTGGYHMLNGGEKTGSGPTAGLGVEWKSSDRFGLFIEGLWQGSMPDDAFEGAVGGSSLDNLFTVGLGFRIRLTQPKNPRFSVSIAAPDTALVGDVVNLRASVSGDPSSPVYLSWRVERFTEYRGDNIRHAFGYLGPQRITVIASNDRYEVRESKEIVVVDDPLYKRGDELLPGRPTAVTGHVRLLEIYGDRQVKVGEAHNYRVRLRPGATWPVNYSWDMGDGSLVIGNNVLHRYMKPGSYTVTAIARNPLNSDTLTTVVTVQSPQSADAAKNLADRNESTAAADTDAHRRRVARYQPDELRSPSGIVVSSGGYGWVVANYMDRTSAEERMRQFKVRGFRTDIVSDSQGGGSSVYRVIVGQFASSRAALAAKREVQRLNDIPVSLVEIGAPSRLPEPARTTPQPVRRSARTVSDDSPPVLTRPVVRHMGPENATSLDVSQLGASDPESNITKIEYRLRSVDGADVWTDWTTIVEPDTPSAETRTVVELPMFAADQDVVLDARATNGAGLTTVTSATVGVDVDESPPVFDATDVGFARVDSELVLELNLSGMDDRESGIVQARFRVVDAADPSVVYWDWEDVTGRRRVMLSVARMTLGDARRIIVELEAQNGAGAVSAYAKSVEIPATVAERQDVVSNVSVPSVRQPSVSPGVGVVRTVDPSLPGPSVESLKVYIRENRLLVFLDGISDEESIIERVEYRVLDAENGTLNSWTTVTLVPPGKQSYGLQMHRLPLPAGASKESHVEIRLTNEKGGQTIVSGMVGAEL